MSVDESNEWDDLNRRYLKSGTNMSDSDISKFKELYIKKYFPIRFKQLYDNFIQSPENFQNSPDKLYRFMLQYQLTAAAETDKGFTDKQRTILNNLNELLFLDSLHTRTKEQESRLISLSDKYHTTFDKLVKLFTTTINVATGLSPTTLYDIFSGSL